MNPNFRNRAYQFVVFLLGLITVLLADTILAGPTVQVAAKVDRTAALSSRAGATAAGPPSIPADRPTYINVGSTALYFDERGNSWLPDRGYVGGAAFDRGGLPIVAAHDAELYRTGRAGMSRYEFSAADGRYMVVLYLAETDPVVTDAGQRVFSVDVGGEQQRDIDIFSLAGGRNVPLIKYVPVVVKDKKLIISFSGARGVPILNALEILPDQFPPTTPETQQGLGIEDFEGYNGSNEAMRQVCKWEERSNPIALLLDPDMKLSGKYGLRMDYSIDTSKAYADYGAFSINKNLDLSAYNTLRFWVKPDGSNRKGFILLRDTTGNIRTVNFRLAGIQPRIVRFPLSSFGFNSVWWHRSRGFDFSKVVGMSVFVHFIEGASLGSGTIYFDRFEAVNAPATAPPTIPWPDDKVISPTTKSVETFENYRSDDEMREHYGWVPHGGMMTISLDHNQTGDGANSMRFDYAFGKRNYSAFFTFVDYDWSNYNTLRFWLRPDGSGNRLRFFIRTMGDFPRLAGLWEYFVPLTGTTPRIVEVPFRDFIGDSADLSHIGEMSFWVMKDSATSAGTIYLDQIEVFKNPKIRNAKALPPPPPVLPADRATRIDVGNDKDYVAPDGAVWLSDRGYHWGRVSPRRDVPIANTSIPEIYRTERVNMEGYHFIIPNGNYLVNFHLSESWVGIAGPGQRVFDIKINGAETRGVDILAATGAINAAYVKSIPVTVTTGKLDVSFREVANHAKLDALEIIPTGGASPSLAPK